MIDFILKSTLCLGVLYAVYVFLLEKEKMHRFNRFFLLSSLVFSLAIPFVTFEIIVESVAVVSQEAMPLLPVSSVVVEAKTDYLPIALWSLYGVVTTALSVRFILNLIKIRQKIKTNPTESIQSSTLVLLDEAVLPHTFLDYVFINKEDYEKRKIEDELYAHELTHARQKHTLDILFIEILKTLFWFNPMFVLYKKAIQLNHEFLADENVVSSYNNVPFYQNLLLEKASWNSNFYLASNLNFLVTKKRLIMMTKTASARIILLKKIALLPLLTGLVYFLCAETVAQQKNETPTHEPQTADNKTRDEYFAGVRIKVYKNGYTTATETKGSDLLLDKLYEELTPKEKEKYAVWLHVPKAMQKKSLTQKELDVYKDAQKFAIWIDGKNVPNTELNHYKPKEIAYFSGSSVFKNARTKKHPQPFQFWFYTHSYFDKSEMGKPQEKYGSDLIEIFENHKDKKGNKQTVITNKVSAHHNLYTETEKAPTFQGGLQEFYTYIGANFKLPNVKNLEGKIMMQFVVETDGSLTEIKTLKDIGHGTGDEAIRVLKNAPKWVPGEQDGKPVRVMYTLPISISTK